MSASWICGKCGSDKIEREQQGKQAEIRHCLSCGNIHTVGVEPRWPIEWIEDKPASSAPGLVGERTEAKNAGCSPISLSNIVQYNGGKKLSEQDVNRRLKDFMTDRGRGTTRPKATAKDYDPAKTITPVPTVPPVPSRSIVKSKSRSRAVGLGATIAVGKRTRRLDPLPSHPPPSPKVRKGKSPKYTFTPEQDEQIRKIYREVQPVGRNAAIRELAAAFGIPRWKVSKHARDIGAYEPRIKEPKWSKEELTLLEQLGHLTAERIYLHFKRAGYSRSVTGILLMRKRRRFKGIVKWYSARALAAALGVDDHAVTGYITGGYLRAEKRGTLRTKGQGGDTWFITKDDVREFVIREIGQIDIRKIDKFWLVDLLAGEQARSEVQCQV